MYGILDAETEQELINGFMSLPDYRMKMLKNTRTQMSLILKDRDSGGWPSINRSKKLTCAPPPSPWVELRSLSNSSSYPDHRNFIKRHHLISGIQTNKVSKTSGVPPEVYAFQLWLFLGQPNGNNMSKDSTKKTRPEPETRIFNIFRYGQMTTTALLPKNILVALTIWGWDMNARLKNRFCQHLAHFPTNTAEDLMYSFSHLCCYHDVVLLNTKHHAGIKLRKVLEPREAKKMIARLVDMDHSVDVWDFMQQHDLLPPLKIASSTTPRSSNTSYIKPTPTMTSKNRGTTGHNWAPTKKNGSIPRLTTTSNISNKRAPTQKTVRKKTVRISEPVVYSYMLWFLGNESPGTILDAFYNQTTDLKNNSGLKRQIREGLEVWNWRRNIDIKNEFVRQFYPNGDGDVLNLDAAGLINAFSSMSYHERVMTSTKQQIINMLQTDNGVSELNSYSSLWSFVTTNFRANLANRASNLQQDDLTTLGPARKSPWTGKNPSKPYPSNMTPTRKSS
jgi:hypothetical protein